jgi:hypothetical protein
MDQFETDKRNETFVFDNNDNGLDIYLNATNVIQGQNVPCDDVNATCNYTSDLVMSDSVVPVLHATAPITPVAIDGRVDWYLTSSNEPWYNHHNNTIPTQNPPQSVTGAFSLPGNFS